jgi:hypothetical protein
MLDVVMNTAGIIVCGWAGLVLTCITVLTYIEYRAPVVTRVEAWEHEG